jgi:hypothetical protein
LAWILLYLLVNEKNYLVVTAMFRKFIRFSFLTIVFISGVLAGTINGPKIMAYSNAVGDGTNIEKPSVKPMKKKHSNRPRVV